MRFFDWAPKVVAIFLLEKFSSLQGVPLRFVSKFRVCGTMHTLSDISYGSNLSISVFLNVFNESPSLHLCRASNEVGEVGKHTEHILSFGWVGEGPRIPGVTSPLFSPQHIPWKTRKAKMGEKMAILWHVHVGWDSLLVHVKDRRGTRGLWGATDA